MTEQQEVLETARPRRRILGVFLLGMVPLVVAGTAGAAAAGFTPEPQATTVALIERVPAQPAVDSELAPVTAAGNVDDVDTTADVPQISISVEPEPEPVAAAPSSGSNASGAKASGSTATSSGSTQKSTGSSSGSTTSASSTQTAQAYCSSPSSPYAASGSPKALLTAANKERARIGARALSWSGSLASAATSWSQTLAGRDTQGDGSALAHNPNRPGAENVAMAGSSGGMSVGTAVAKAHSGWMYSYGHCVNVMNPAFSSMGAGSATNPTGTVVYTTANYR
mgnify:CR=1 FL=1